MKDYFVITYLDQFDHWCIRHKTKRKNDRMEVFYWLDDCIKFCLSYKIDFKEIEG